MRIEWNLECAEHIAGRLDAIHAQALAALDRSRAARAALAEANPAGDDRRLNDLTAQLEEALRRLREAETDADELRSGTRVMIDAFEGAEREAVGIVESLETGFGSVDFADGAGAGAPERTDRALMPETPPMPLPRPILGPHSAMGPLGPVPGWLAERMNEQF